MDSTYRPQSPDLSSYTPQSPDLSGFQPQSPDLSGALPPSRYGHHPSHSGDQFNPGFGHNTYAYGSYPTSAPLQPQYSQPQYYQQQQQFDMAPQTHFKTEDDNDDDYLPDAPPKRMRRAQQTLPSLSANGSSYDVQHSQLTGPLQGMSTQPPDPTLGVQLKTSFPVARIKRIMQADEDIGKVAQVTPHIVSRALELFMIKLISASAAQARGGPQGSGKGQKRILAQHMKKAIKADNTFDFLETIVDRVPDAPVKGKKEAGSDSEEGASAPKSAKKKGKKRKDTGDDIEF